MCPNENFQFFNVANLLVIFVYPNKMGLRTLHVMFFHARFFVLPSLKREANPVTTLAPLSTLFGLTTGFRFLSIRK
jgi:hypothetical protein